MKGRILLTFFFTFLTPLLGLPSALPMTDYSQLNHDEPTHWTKAATTPTEEQKLNTINKLDIEKTTSSIYLPISQQQTTLQNFYETNYNQTNNDQNIEDEENPLISKTVVTKENNLTDCNENNLSISSTVLNTQDVLTESSETISSNENITVIPKSSSTEKDSNVDIINDDIQLNTIDTDFVNDASKKSEEVLDDKENNNNNNNYLYTVVNNKENLTLNSTKDIYEMNIIEDIRSMFTNDAETGESPDISDSQLDEVLSNFRHSDIKPKTTTSDETLIVQNFEDNGYDNYQELDDFKTDDPNQRAMYDALVLPTIGDGDNYDAESPFKHWDRDSEEQERTLENIVFQTNESVGNMKLENNGNNQVQTNGKWFLLLLSGNSTIVQMRQQDFAKYLKLNLAARLSLEYDELRVNKVVFAPPRLMVNVSVIPTDTDNIDKEFDLNERIFGEEDAPLHKLAETNATLLELSGEEYHVVRFLSLRSQQPVLMDEAVSETTSIKSDKHTDIEYLIYLAVGGPCLSLLIFIIFALYRLYIIPRKIRWPWKRNKENGPRHQRMNDRERGPLTVIYSGAFAQQGPPSGSWLDGSDCVLADEPILDNPAYGMGALEQKTICDPTILDSPRFNIDSKLRIFGCRPHHLRVPISPMRRINKGLDVRIPSGLDNPNYLT